ncbi:FAD-binding and (Fe-S)-binding domain-containing protein [Halobaculum limi]|uniref:FAD-binding and (Fe-S)-binding domain-containing protein n=1 Tax=Halobaculum limi TaxID=3031916 RepID=UPI002404E496|nr:FAD-binding and (Fe-S)-binding domain-containing protein [Halobaculum sp. YSMS11]
MSSDSPAPPDGGPDLTDADYDYRSDDVRQPGLVADLEERLDGDVRFDTYSRQLYATDASAYQQLPIGVVFPRHTDDVAATMTYCADNEIPVLPRGGGTSLAGQTVNEAVVLDFTRYMNDLVDLDPDAREATVEPGCILANLNQAAAPHGLKFGPDPAWRDKSAIGGAIGNNSTGSHSLKYGKTDAYVESCEVVLADGSVETFGEIRVEEMRAAADPDGDLLARIYAALVEILDEEADEVTARYPEMKRNVSGYNLDVLVQEARGEWADGDDPGEEGVVNLARLLCGSEGTLGIVTEATVSLVEVPETKAVALLTYDSLNEAMDDVAPILEHDPAAVEVMDDTLLDLARETTEFGDVVGLLPDGTDSVLLVEFYAESDDDGRQKVADLLADRRPGTDTEFDPSDDRVDSGETVRARAAMEAHDEQRRATFWKMRKSGLPILLGRTSDAKHISFIEDCAVPPEHLSAYVEDFQEILEEVGTFASFYAHAGPGVLHVRPLVNTKSLEGMEQLEAIAEGATDLVVKYGGSVSGEHGDGRARTQWNRKLYGDDLWNTFRDLKTAFDPDWLLNPGNVCGDHSLTEHLRFDPEYAFDAGFDPELDWDNENGFQGMTELCHGCGGCRGEQDTTGGVMCPTYRAADEEIQSTRGRANLLRGAMSGDLPADPFDEEFASEVMDLCIGCKGCKRNCPSGVDMAKLKAEVAHESHERDGASLRDRLFANVNLLSRVGSALAPLSNLATRVPGSGVVGEKLLGIASERELPTFHRETLRDWFDARGGSRVAAADAERVAVLVPDTYTNYNHPEAGKAAVGVLEAAGVRVELADVEDTGRPAYSLGFLDTARERTAAAVEDLAPRVEAGKDVVVVEPSEAVMLQSDLLDFHGDERAASVAANSYGVLEYVDTFRLDEAMDLAGSGSLTYHGHCHQKATKKDHHAVGVLRRAGYEVDPLDSTCCGMAGSFGYEAEHYSMSTAIADILFGQVDASAGTEVTAPGASCRSQLGHRDGTDEEPPHPVEKVAAALQ